jgi:integrase
MHDASNEGVPLKEATMVKFVEGYADQLQVPAGAKDVQVFDAELPGFGIRKFASGRATYFVKYQVGTRQRRLTLGVVVRGDLKAMRLRASEILFKARAGVDIIAEKEKTKREAAQVVTLGELVPLYLKRRVGELREKSYIEAERYLTKTWRPLHGLPIKDVTRQVIVKLIDEMEHKVAADRARAALSAFFSWAIESSYAEQSPMLHIKARAGSTAREQVLSEAELVEVWRACGDGDDFGTIVRLLILTGQRRDEIGGLEWREIGVEKREISLPGRRTKNGRPHLVPLAAAALGLLGRVEPREGRQHVFGDGSEGFSGFAYSKINLDQRIAARRGGTPLPAWQLRDLRRSFATHVAELGFAAPHVVEATLNHISGSKAGVAGVYNKAAYLAERREALDKWAAYIVGQVDGPLIRGQGAEPGKPAEFSKLAGRGTRP